MTTRTQTNDGNTNTWTYVKTSIACVQHQMQTNKDRQGTNTDDNVETQLNKLMPNIKQMQVGVVHSPPGVVE